MPEKNLPLDNPNAESRLCISGFLGKGLLIPFVFSLLIQTLDQEIPGVSITPLLSLGVLCALALFGLFDVLSG